MHGQSVFIDDNVCFGPRYSFFCVLAATPLPLNDDKIKEKCDFLGLSFNFSDKRQWNTSYKGSIVSP